MRNATPLLAAALTVVRGAFKGSLRDFEGAMQVLADGATSQHDAQPFIEHVVAYMVRRILISGVRTVSVTRASFGVQEMIDSLVATGELDVEQQRLDQLLGCASVHSLPARLPRLEEAIVASASLHWSATVSPAPTVPATKTRSPATTART